MRRVSSFLGLPADPLEAPADPRGSADHRLKTPAIWHVSSRSGVATLHRELLYLYLYRFFMRCRRWTRATRCFRRIVLYTEVGDQCDKLAKVVRQTSTVASTVNLVRPMTVASLSH